MNVFCVGEHLDARSDSGMHIFASDARIKMLLASTPAVPSKRPELSMISKGKSNLSAILIALNV
jgi:hypothetical protein